MYKIAALLLTLFFAVPLNAEELKINLKDYDFDYARVTVYTPYSGVGVRHVNYSTEVPEHVSMQQPNLRYGGPTNIVEVLKDVKVLNVYLDWTPAIKITGPPPLDVDNIFVKCLFRKDGKEQVVFFTRTESRFEAKNE